MSTADQPPIDSRCEHGWGDFRCVLAADHDGGPHFLGWNGDEDDE